MRRMVLGMLCWLALGSTAWPQTPGEIPLRMQEADLPVLFAPEPRGGDHAMRLLFDAATPECAAWTFRMPADYGSALTFKLLYVMHSALVGSVKLSVAVAALTPGALVVLDTKPYDTPNLCTEGTVPTVPGLLRLLTCPLSHVDTVAPGDLTRVRLCRVANDPADTARGDLAALAAVLEYVRVP